MPPSGAAVLPSGAAVLPSGAAVPPSGVAVPPSGAAVPPNGAAVSPSGAAELPAGAAVPPSGAAVSPSGAAVSPGGAAVLPRGAAVPPSGAFIFHFEPSSFRVSSSFLVWVRLFSASVSFPLFNFQIHRAAVSSFSFLQHHVRPVSCHSWEHIGVSPNIKVGSSRCQIYAFVSSFLPSASSFSFLQHHVRSGYW